MTVKEIFSADKKRKCVITKSEKNFLSYHFEVYETYDEEELKYFHAGCPAGYWCLLCEAYHRPVFDNIDDENPPEEVKMCCCEIAELAYKRDQSAQSDGVSSESVQGWSKSYESTESRRNAFDKAVRECIYNWLSSTGLLYRGIR